MKFFHMEADVFLLLGSDRGDRQAMLAAALSLLEERAGPVLVVSSVYETAPWGMDDEVPFLNQVAGLHTRLSPPELLEVIQNIERELGRQREKERGAGYHPRTLDIDILLWGDRVIRDGRLEVPHPRLGRRRFALVPLAEVAAERVHPVTGITVAAMLERCDDDGWVRKISG